MSAAIYCFYFFTLIWSINWVQQGREISKNKAQHEQGRNNILQKSRKMSREGKAAENFGRIMTAFGYTLLLTTVVGAILQPAVIFPTFLILAFLLEFVIGLFIYPMYPTDESDN